MFHGESQVFSEGVEEGEVGFCVVFVSEGFTSIVDEVGVGGGRVGRGGFRPLPVLSLRVR